MCPSKMIEEDDRVLERVRGLRQSGVIYLRNGVFFQSWLQWSENDS